MTGANNIKVGAIVHVDKKGRRFYALVKDRVAVNGKLVSFEIMPLCRETYRACTAREVIGHYKKMAGSA
jgi:hypothetical protein